MDQLRGRLEAWMGSAVQGYEILLEGAGRALDTAPDRAASMLFDALRAASAAGDMERAAGDRRDGATSR